jgi:hypothetical protein
MPPAWLLSMLPWPLCWATWVVAVEGSVLAAFVVLVQPVASIANSPGKINNNLVVFSKLLVIISSID